MSDYTDIGFGPPDEKKTTKDTLEFQKQHKCRDPMWHIIKCNINIPFHMIQYTTWFLLEVWSNDGSWTRTQWI